MIIVILENPRIEISSNIIFWFLFLVLFFFFRQSFEPGGQRDKFHGFVKLTFHSYSSDTVLRAKEKEEVRRKRLQAWRNDRKLLKTVSKCSHSDTYANSFPGCNFLFSFRTSTLLLLIKDEEPDTATFRGDASPIVKKIIFFFRFQEESLTIVYKSYKRKVCRKRKSKIVFKKIQIIDCRLLES